MKKSRLQPIFLLLAAALLISAVLLVGARLLPRSTADIRLTEQPILPIPLAGPLAGRQAQISGLAWFGDSLILLPQYPDFAAEGTDGFLYALPKTELLAFLDGEIAGPLEPRAIPFAAPGLAAVIDHFQGYESIGFLGTQAYLTIEAGQGSAMTAFLVSGTIEPDLSVLTLDVSRADPIPAQASLDNLSDEALVVFPGQILTFYEANGAGPNPQPLAHRFGPGLEPLGTLPFPALEFRLTDASQADAAGRFWVINYNYPGDLALQTRDDPLAQEYGLGASQAASQMVERLVELQYADGQLMRLDQPPIYLQLAGDSRNWEGLVVMDGRGFLLATDTFPETILAFVPWP